MVISTWNVERIKHINQLNEIKNLCQSTKADILVLTETDHRLVPDYKYSYHTELAIEQIPNLYKETENRVSIYSNYECERKFETYDKYTSVCVELKTEFGNLIVYGTIIGIYGNRDSSFEIDLQSQAEDIKRFAKYGNLCVIGDYNCSFYDNYYYTKTGRANIQEYMRASGLSIVTEDRKECIDHIALSDSYTEGLKLEIDEWNFSKKLSDHKGIMVKLSE